MSEYKFPYPTLLDADYSLKGNREAFRNMPAVVQMFQGRDVPLADTLDEDGIPVHTDELGKPVRGQLEEVFDHLVNDRGERDGYAITGEMVNQFMQSFPELSDAWEKLSPDQRWIFTEGLYYGIETHVREMMGYTQQ